MSLLPEFEYKRPESLKELLSRLSEHKGHTAILAGGTDLVPRMKMGLKKPDLIMDIKGIEGLNDVKSEDEKVRIGVLTTIFEIKNNTLLRDKYPVLYEAAALTTSETLQQRGTLGGNILQDTRCLYYNKTETWRHSFRPCYKFGGNTCNAAKGSKKCFAVYCGDLAPALISLNASISLLDKDGEREIALKNIFSGEGKSPFSLGKNSFIKEIILTNSQRMGGYEKLRLRKSIDYPLANMALSIDREETGRLVVGSMGAKPVIYEFNSFEELRKIPERLSDNMAPINNMMISPLYRKHMVRQLSKRLIRRF